MAARYEITVKGVEIKTPQGKVVTVSNLLQAYSYCRSMGYELKEVGA